MLKLRRSRKTNTSEQQLLLLARAFGHYAIHNNRAVLDAIVTGNPVKAAQYAQRFDDDVVRTTKKWLH